MKKILASMLLAAMLLTLFSACGGEKPASDISSTSVAAVDSVAETDSTGSEANAEGDTTSDWAYIEEKGNLVIGITYFEPMNFLDNTGKLTGFETEFAEAVCKLIGVTPEFVEIQWSAKETELSAKSIDCIWNGMTITEERAANMSISNPYMANKQVLVVKKDNVVAMSASVDGMSVVAEAESAGEAAAQTEEFFAKAIYTAVDTQSKALIEVKSGTADACVIDYVMSIGMIGEGTDFADLAVVEDRGFGEEEYGVAMRKGDVELTQKVNDAIQQLMDNGELVEIAKKYKLEHLLVTE